MDQMNDWEISNNSFGFTQLNVEGGYSNGVLRRQGLPEKECSFVPVKVSELHAITSTLERLRGSDAILPVCSLLSHRNKNKFLLVTERIDCSLGRCFKNAGEPYNTDGFLKPFLTEKIKGLLACFVSLYNNRIKHCGGNDIQETQIFVVKGQVKVLYVTMSAPHEPSKQFDAYTSQQLNTIFSRLLQPKNNIPLAMKEYIDFCQMTKFSQEKFRRHPLLLSPWERLVLPTHVHCSLLADTSYKPSKLHHQYPNYSWKSRISRNSITGVILAHRPYDDTAPACLDFLRNFIEHVHQSDTLDKYHLAIGDNTKTVQLPSAVGMNQILVSQLGEDYLLNIFNFVDSWHWK